MKNLIITLVFAIGAAFTAQAQNERDFATLFAEAEKTATFEVRTIGPQMLQRMLSLTQVEENETLATMLRQLRSLRVAMASENTEQLFGSANQFAKQNAARYQLHSATDERSVYTRSRKGMIVEVVVLMQQPEKFFIFDLTGKMQPEFIEQMEHWEAIATEKK